jgi:hypothetical protein
MPIVLSTPRRPSTYRREITSVLCLKAIGLAALYYLFFSSANQMTPTPQDVAHHLVDKAFSSEVGTGSPEENASKQKP